jgi:methylthioribose-1-phosphate isomerase
VHERDRGSPLTSLPEKLPSAVEWVDGPLDGHLEVIDQTVLPERCEVRALRTVDEVVDAIRRLVVRGAPALGVCGAFGLIVGLDEAKPQTLDEAKRTLERVAERIESARPTAVNLSYAVRRVLKTAANAQSAAETRERALATARRIQQEDRESCRRIGEFGRQELASVRRVLTHCNTGRLATAGWGTALGVVYAKAQAKEPVQVLVSETRPLLQGARLTAWELRDAGIPVTVVTEGSAGAAIASGHVDAVIVGCDRVARNGDTANKVGTYSHALAARANGIPFYVAGPMSSFDPTIGGARDVVIEQRSADEVRRLGTVVLAPEVEVWNPAFDVTPADLVTAFITDVGVLRPPYRESIAWALEEARRQGLR